MISAISCSLAGKSDGKSADKSIYKDYLYWIILYFRLEPQQKLKLSISWKANQLIDPLL